jgi:predicted Holliday junction resolvase-like endonuclease
MDWVNILEQIFELLILPVVSITGIYLTYLIGAKIKELKQKTNDATAQKYLDMLNSTITDAVLATTQTYVETLKKQGKFDEEAQKEAFKKTYEAVMKVLSADAVKFITESVGDLETYVTNRIETEVKLTKNY